MNDRLCKNCGSEIQYNNQYDAYFCELCNKWLEESCGNPTCDYCNERPEKPSQIL
jgi:hypothetical protein